MAPRDPENLDELRANAASAVAIEALWNGDTEGWFVDLYAVVKGDSGYDARCLQSFRDGGDVRVFNNQVPRWPEAFDAARVGEQLAGLLGVPFHFPSPNHPENDCPHWWEIDQSYPCSRCQLLLLQVPDCRWRGVCYQCHLAIKREAKAARSASKTEALRCYVCGNPVEGLTEDAPCCRACTEV